MLLLVASFLRAQEAAGDPNVAARATAVLNLVEAIDPSGAVRRLARGDLVFVGETLRTGPKGRAQLRFTDRGVMTLRPATALAIDDYQFDPATPSLNRQALSLDQGGFRAATGAVAQTNRSGYRVESPLGVVGVRGTNYEAVLTPSNTLLLGAYEGTIDVTSSTGAVAVLGEGADFNFARIDSDGSVEYLLEPPAELASSAGVDDDQEEEAAEDEAAEEEGSEDSEDEAEEGDTEEGDAEADEGAEEGDAEEGDTEEGDAEADEGAAEDSEAEAEGGSVDEAESEGGSSDEGGAEEKPKRVALKRVALRLRKALPMKPNQRAVAATRVAPMRAALTLMREVLAKA